MEEKEDLMEIVVRKQQERNKKYLMKKLVNYGRK